MPKRKTHITNESSPTPRTLTHSLIQQRLRARNEYVLNPNTLSLIPLKQVLKVPVATSLRLSLSPGDPWFRTWYMISAYVPVLTSCIAPIANMMSVLGLIQNWRTPYNTNLKVHDSPLVTALNVISLALGIIGNLLFLLNFSVKATYLITQTISIFCWISASLCLLAAILITNHSFIGKLPLYYPTEGFWYAVATCGLYFGCASLLITNFTGYILRKYPPMFNLSPKERTLMFFTVSYAVLSVIGLVCTKHLIEGLSYGSALYFCTVSFLTIGLGDITPVTPLARAIVLILSFCGVMNMGLIVAMIRQTVISYHGPTLMWHSVECRRARVYKNLARDDVELTPEESFERMRKIRKLALSKHEHVSLIIELLIYVCFWMVGALVFMRVEGWSFYNGVYFCFLCLLTIGYGDYSPKSNFGRVFFVLWAVSAVPLMTVLVSNGGDTLFGLADQLGSWLYKTTVGQWAKRFLHFTLGRQEQLEAEMETDPSATNSSLSQQSSEVTLSDSKMSNSSESRADSMPVEPYWSNLEWPEFRQRLIERIHHNEKVLSQIYTLFKQSEPLFVESVDNQDKRYTHDEWCAALKLESSWSSPNPTHNPKYQLSNFWLSKESPLRLPLKEPNYLLMMVLKKMETEMEQLLQMEARGLEKMKEEIKARPY